MFRSEKKLTLFVVNISLSEVIKKNRSSRINFDKYVVIQKVNRRLIRKVFIPID